MKREWHTTVGASLFLGILCIAYWLLSYEDSGTVMLLFGGAAYLLLGGYLLLQWHRRGRLPRAEDKEDGSYEEGAGEALGFFPAASIWPAGLGAGATLMAIGGVWGLWYAYMGGIVAIGAIIGWVTESDYTKDVLPGIDPAEVEAGHDIASGATRPHMDEDLEHLHLRRHH